MITLFARLVLCALFVISALWCIAPVTVTAQEYDEETIEYVEDVIGESIELPEPTPVVDEEEGGFGEMEE